MAEIKKTYILNNFKFVVTKKTIMNTDNSNEDINITMYNCNRKCVEITINKNDYNGNQLNASLDRFEYQLDSNIMMETLILFLTTNMKTNMNMNMNSYMNINIKTITLEDSSRIKCSGSNFSIIYYDLFLFKYGSPYYNYTYGFDFYYESDREQHIENLSLISGVTINKQEFIKFLMSKKINIDISRDNIVNHEHNIITFLETIINGILATEFVKQFSHKDNLSYLLHYFFMYMKTITRYQTMIHFPCVLYI